MVRIDRSVHSYSAVCRFVSAVAVWVVGFGACLSVAEWRHVTEFVAVLLRCHGDEVRVHSQVCLLCIDEDEQQFVVVAYCYDVAVVAGFSVESELCSVESCSVGGFRVFDRSYHAFALLLSHHDYGMVEMQYIMERAISRGVKALVTTGKDAVKIPTEFIYLHRDVPLYILDMEIQITSGEEAFADTIKAAIKKEKASK